MTKSKLTAADEKFIAEFIDPKKKISFDATPIYRENRFTGERFEVDPISAACIDFVYKVEPIIQRQNEIELKLINPKFSLRNIVSKFDRARYIVMKLDPTAYMGILD